MLTNCNLFLLFFTKKFGELKKSSTFAPELNVRVLSSAGSEHLPYKQRVTGSNPVGPTKIQILLLFS